MASNVVRMGDVVIYTPAEGEKLANYQSECPAIVTSVHGPDLVNLRLVEDGPSPAPRGGLLTLEELARAGLAYEAHEREGLEAAAKGEKRPTHVIDYAAMARGEIVDLGPSAFVDVLNVGDRDWRGSVSRGEGPRTWRSIGA